VIYRLFIALLVAAASSTALAAQTQPDLSAPPDVGSPPADAEKTASGLASKVIEPGAGPDKPAATDYVTVHYTGWSSDGKLFDSSYNRGNPSMFPLDKSLAGWRECVLLMTVGEKRRCWVPQNLAYRGQPGRPGGTIVFDIELIETRANPRTAPADVKEPPADAMKTASGLAYQVLKRGVGARRPASFERVTVHYTGWTTDGKMFDSSVSRGSPTTFRLDSVIPGWTEGVGLMVEGERTRFWIPQDLAYKGEAGGPRGMLVFDVELIRIER
jgi:FKBP-type peptidyl-prolyl cis-trans isomerase